MFRPLVKYLTDGFIAHSVNGGSGARFVGHRSCNGRGCDDMEAYSRLAPFWAAWLAGSVDPRVHDCFVEGLEVGTNPRSRGYWGALEHGGQRICEASDVALAIWFSRTWIERALPSGAMGRVLEWLGTVGGRIPDNNWHLFPATILAVRALFLKSSRWKEFDYHVGRVSEFEVGAGLFRDGTDGHVDWYNAWGFHYNLGMIEAIVGTAAVPFAARMRQEVVRLVLSLIGPFGVPMFGRSIHYRGATPAPLTVSIMLGDEATPAGQVRRALRLVWLYHVGHGMLSNGTISQGYHASNKDWVDAYSGPASALWSLRSLIPVLSLNSEHPFWSSAESRLRIDCESFRIPVLNCIVSGNRASGDIRIIRRGGRISTPPLIETQSPLQRSYDLLRGWVRRPQNVALRYGLPVYSSKYPFCERSTLAQYENLLGDSSEI